VRHGDAGTRARPELFSRGQQGGIARLQVALMYPGSLGSPDFDVFVADKVVRIGHLSGSTPTRAETLPIGMTCGRPDT
jgi:hypothetical protein